MFRCPTPLQATGLPGHRPTPPKYLQTFDIFWQGHFKSLLAAQHSELDVNGGGLHKKTFKPFRGKSNSAG